MEATLLLADAAEQANPQSPKITAMGIGWDRTMTPLPPHVLIALIKVPWTETNRPIPITIEMVSEDGHPVMVPTPLGEQPLQLAGQLEVGRPPGVQHGTAIQVPQIVQCPPGLSLAPGAYVWRLEIDGESHESWAVRFTVSAPAPQPPLTG